MHSCSIIRFDDYELDLGSYEVRKSGRTIRLEKTPMELLILLAERRGALVTREEIIRRLWGDNVFVDTRQGINTAVYKIRTALRDDPEHPRIIQTVSGKGYRLISGDASADEEHAHYGAQSAPTVSRQSGLKRQTWRLLVVLPTVLIAAVMTAVFGWRLHVSRMSPHSGSFRSIAVLPLINLSRDPEQEYFADGMTDALITDLAKISSLRVISRTSVMQYKHAAPPLPQIGKELNIDAVVEGSVARAGDLVRVTARLVEASTERPLWAESYERELSDILNLQDDIARAIADQVLAKLAPEGAARLARVRRVDPRVYDLFLRGRYVWAKRGKQNLLTALQFFQRAVSLDPNYAPAWAGIAESYGLLGNGEIVAVHEVYPKAKAAALKALQLDPDLSDAHTALAEVLNDYEWNWVAAEREYKRAIELNPNDATAHHWYAMSLMWVGRTAEAIEEIENALRIDPAGVHINANAGLIFLWARQYDRAMAQAQRTLKLEPNDGTSHLVLAQANLKKGNYSAAIVQFKMLLSLPEVPSVRGLAWLAWAYALSDRREEARNILGKLRQLSRTEYCPPTSMAMIYCALGQRDEAFAWLDKALQQREGIQLLSIKVNLYFDSLRSDPRFVDVLRRRGLAE